MQGTTPRKLSRAAAGAALLACILALVPGSLTCAEDIDELEAIIAAPSVEDLGRTLDAMVQTGAPDEFWKMANQPGAEFTGGLYSEWFNAAEIPLGVMPWAVLSAGQMRSKGCVPRLLRLLQEPAGAGDAFARECVLYVLGQLRDPAAAEAVKRFETHADEWTRFFAKEAGARIAGKPDDTTPRWSKTRLNLASCQLNWYFPEMVKAEFNGTVNEFRGHMAPLGPLVPRLINEGVAFDEKGDPVNDIVLFFAMHPAGFRGDGAGISYMLWRAYHYVRRGGQLIMDGPHLFSIERIYEMIGEGDSAIQGKLQSEYRYRRGPWDALYPQKFEKNPAFPPIDDQGWRYKEFYFSYTRIGRGGCLMVTEEPESFEKVIATTGPLPVHYWELPDALAYFKAIFAWLKDGPEHRAASVGWRDEPLPPPKNQDQLPIFYAGAANKMIVSLMRHQKQPPELALEARLFTADNRLVGSVAGKPVTGKAGEWTLQNLGLELPILTLPNTDYRLELAALDPAGKVLHRMARKVEVRGRFEIAIEGWPDVVDGEVLARTKLHIKDVATGPYPPLQARLQLVNEDFNRVYRIWRAPWNGKDDVVLDLQLPGALPAAQYTLHLDLVDDKDQVYGRLVRPLARQAVYEQRRIFQWSEWIQQPPSVIAENLHKVGINTLANNAAYMSYPGFPYEWYFDTTDIFIQPSRMGDHYLATLGKYKGERGERVGPYRPKKPALLDPGQPHGTTGGYLGAGQSYVKNARRLSLDMIEESKMQDLSYGYNYMLQLEYMLQDIWRTVENLNNDQGSDFLSWEELPFTNFKLGFGWSVHEGGWVFYTQRAQTLYVRSLALREHNPYVRIEAGAGNRADYYDGLHNRFYEGNLLTPALTLLGDIPTHPRAAKTWLMDFRNDYTAFGQARKIWSSIAGNARHITLFQSGGHFPGASWWHGLTTLSQAIHSVRPYEPILVDTRDRLSSDIANFGSGESPALEALLALGIMPDVIQRKSYMARIEGEKNLGTYKILIDGGHGDLKEDLATLRRTVENGAVLIATPKGNPAIAAEFGVELPEPGKRGAVKRIAFDPLAKLLPGVAGAWLYGKLGPATGVTPKSGLTLADGLIFGQVGKGLFIYVNLESERYGRLGGRTGDDTFLWDYEGWARLWLAMVERQGLTRDVFYAVDRLGRPDVNFVCRILDTDDGSQRYLLLHAHSSFEGSLSGWDVDAREKQAIFRFAPDKPIVLKAGMQPVKLKWQMKDSTDCQVWMRRRVRSAASGKPVYPPNFSVSCDGHSWDVSLRADVPTDDFVWEAAGGNWQWFGGKEVELTLKGGDREIEVDRIVVLPSAATARLVIADPRIVALYDLKDDRTYPVVETRGLRHADVSVAAGFGVVLGLVEAPEAKFVARVASPEVGRGGPLRVDCEQQGPDGKVLARSATLMGTLRRGPKNEPVPDSAQHWLLEGGKGIFEYWIRATETEGPATLDVLNMATGQRAQVPLTIRDAGDKNNPHGAGWNATLAQRPPQHVLTVEPLPDLRVPDIGIFDLTGTFTSAADQPLKLEFGSALPDNCFPGGKASRQFTAAPKAKTGFSIPVIITRKTARRIQRRDMTIPVWIQTADGAVVARRNVRLLINPWDVAPPVMNVLLDKGAATLIVANATAGKQTVEIELQPPDDIVIPKPTQRIEVPANKDVNVAFPAKPRDVSVFDGHYAIPYRAAPAGTGAPQEGETRVSVRTLSRWWLSTLDIAPVVSDNLREVGPSAAKSDDMIMAILGNETEAEELIGGGGPWGGVQRDLFEAVVPPQNWTPVLHGASIWLADLATLPKALDVVLAATRVWSPDERTVTVKVGRRTVAYSCLDGEVVHGANKETLGKLDKIRFIGRVLLNGKAIYDSRPKATMPKGPFKLRQGENTLLVQMQPSLDVPLGMDVNIDPGNIFVLFYDAKTGKRCRSLLFDMDRRAGQAAE